MQGELAEDMQKKQAISQMFRLAKQEKAYYTSCMKWNDRFSQMFTEAVYRYHEQPQPIAADHFFLPEEKELLASIGYTPHEMFDYVEDYATLGEPSPSTVLLIAAARRAFFLKEQRGTTGGASPLREIDLPRETDEYQDIAYLPRIIRKAHAKLHGILPPRVMYYCPKDRAFMKNHGDIHPADFLYEVWDARGDWQKVVARVLRMIKENSAAQASRAEAPAAGAPAEAPKSPAPSA